MKGLISRYSRSIEKPVDFPVRSRRPAGFVPLLFYPSSVPSNALIASSRGLLAEGPVALEFSGKGMPDGGPVSAWYGRRKEQGSTRINRIQLRREKQAPYFHQYLVLTCDTGYRCRIDRRPDAGVPVDTILQTGCKAFDTIEEVSNFSLVEVTSDCLVDLRITRESLNVDLSFIVCLCAHIKHDPVACRYSLQKYNCYFFSWTLLAIALRYIAAWEVLFDATAQDDIWDSVWMGWTRSSLYEFDSIALDVLLTDGHLSYPYEERPFPSRPLPPPSPMLISPPPPHRRYSTPRLEPPPDIASYNSDFTMTDASHSFMLISLPPLHHRHFNTPSLEPSPDNASYNSDGTMTDASHSSMLISLPPSHHPYSTPRLEPSPDTASYYSDGTVTDAQVDSLRRRDSFIPEYDGEEDGYHWAHNPAIPVGRMGSIISDEYPEAASSYYPEKRTTPGVIWNALLDDEWEEERRESIQQTMLKEMREHLREEIITEQVRDIFRDVVRDSTAEAIETVSKTLFPSGLQALLDTSWSSIRPSLWKSVNSIPISADWLASLVAQRTRIFMELATSWGYVLEDPKFAGGPKSLANELHQSLMFALNNVGSGVFSTMITRTESTTVSSSFSIELRVKVSHYQIASTPVWVLTIVVFGLGLGTTHFDPIDARRIRALPQ